jgi:hypothetical protein
MRGYRTRVGFLLAAVIAAAAGTLVLGSEAAAQFWGWNRGGWGNDGGGNWSNDRGGWGSRFNDDSSHDRRPFGGRRNGGEIDGGERTTRQQPAAASTAASTGGTSGYYCVRLCDGFYFPLSRAGGFSEAKTLCAGLCPATATEPYSGRNDAIGEARAQNGKTYAALANAFVYRKALKPECGCRSAEAKPMTVANDPTLRSGDLVVTEQGVRVFQGSSSRLPHQASAFVDYRKTRAVSGGLRNQLDAMAKRYYTTRAQASPAEMKAGQAKAAEDGKSSRRTRARKTER